MTYSLFTEALSVGVVTGVFGSLVSLLFMFIFSKNFTLKEYNFKLQVFLSYFVTGFFMHLLLEWTGMNQKFCCQKNRYNCVA